MINGNRRPDYALGYVSQENEFTLADLPVEGEVPDWLFGSLVRLGPGKFGVAGKKLAHHFCGFGMLSRINPTTLAAMALGACSVASAIFLILELSQPYTSLLRISPAGLEQVIVDLDK